MEAPDTAQTRLVESFWMAREPITFRALCEHAVPPETRLLVLDLDRTLHLGRNMGELLGWEVNAHRAYGDAYLHALEPRRGIGRWYLERSRPFGALRYLWGAFRVWGPPGFFYLLWLKLAGRIDLLRRRSFLRFGPEPVTVVQRVPQYVLLRQLVALPDALVRELAARVWARHRQDLVVEREDLAWLRERCPGIRVVLSSASPQQVVEAASAELGVDEVIGSSLRRINSGRGKLETLRERYPELLGAPGVMTVGISDTGYGEDHSWTEAFVHVVDVNSSSGFPPIVTAGSPLRRVFSAQLLTRAEKDARARGEAWLDPRRRGARSARSARDDGSRELGAAELRSLLAPVRAAAEQLARELDVRQRQLSTVLERTRAEISAVDRALESAVVGTLAASRAHRRRLLRAIKARLAADLRGARLARPVSEVAFELVRTLERSRELVEQRVAHG
jgi:hypothetical protein